MNWFFVWKSHGTLWWSKHLTFQVNRLLIHCHPKLVPFPLFNAFLDSKPIKDNQNQCKWWLNGAKICVPFRHDPSLYESPDIKPKSNETKCHQKLFVITLTNNNFMLLDKVWQNTYVFRSREHIYPKKLIVIWGHFVACMPVVTSAL